MAEFFLRQSVGGDPRPLCLRLDHGGRRLLVHLSAQSAILICARAPPTASTDRHRVSAEVRLNTLQKTSFRIRRLGRLPNGAPCDTRLHCVNPEEPFHLPQTLGGFAIGLPAGAQHLAKRRESFTALLLIRRQQTWNGVKGGIAIDEQ